MPRIALFSCEEEAFTPDQVRTAALARGDAEPLLALVRDRLACFALAQHEDWELDDDALQHLSIAFRRENGLRTAEGTEAWMATRGVDVDDFGNYLERSACYDAYVDRLEDAREFATVTETGVMEILWPEAVFIGEADHWAFELAQRAAAALAHVPVAVSGDAQAEDSDIWTARSLEIDAAFERFREATLTEKRLEQSMRSRWQELFVIDCARAVFASAAAAQEAYLCVREDGMSLEDVARDAHGRYARGKTLLCELPPEVRTLALCASEGGVLEPVVIEEEHTLFRIGTKSEPHLDEPRVHQMVAQNVLDQALRPLMQRHIQWHMSGNG